jgi:16S rRNA U1498 N3-methylase RsmE
MSLKSVYLPDPSIENDRIRISGEEHRHLVVARAEADETVEVFDGKGNVWIATVEAAGKRETLVRVKESRNLGRDPSRIASWSRDDPNRSVRVGARESR